MPTTDVATVMYFALYRSEAAGPIDLDDGVCAICVGLFGEYEDAITEARENLALGYSVSIDVGAMTQAEWDAIEEVPDDFTATRTSPPPLLDAARALLVAADAFHDDTAHYVEVRRAEVESLRAAIARIDGRS